MIKVCAQKTVTTHLSLAHVTISIPGPSPSLSAEPVPISIPIIHHVVHGCTTSAVLPRHVRVHTIAIAVVAFPFAAATV